MSARTRRLAEVAVGEALPELALPITATLIVSGAIASRDFTPVHHDRRHAQSQGLRDVIMNTLTTNGLVGRYVTDWTGPDALIRACRLKLGAPNLPGDTMRLRGAVKRKDEAAGTVELEVVGTNSWGDHVTAAVTVALPRGA
jgi:acyl dehydratase